jgi:hypothetical protein
MDGNSQLFLESHNPSMFQSPATRSRCQHQNHGFDGLMEVDIWASTPVARNVPELISWQIF